MRERPEDITELVHYFLRLQSIEMGIQGSSIQNEAMEFLQRQLWLGNVRELEHAIDCVGGRDDEAEARLVAALRKSRSAPPIQSLRRAPDEPDETCWLAGDGWWLSTAPLEA